MLLLTLALASAVVTANGQSKHKLTANVPFDFIVGDKVLAAGQYQLNAVGIAEDALAIRSTDSKNNAIRLTNTIAASQERRPARLVFHRYGNTYFLSQVWEGGENVGRQLKKSQQERAMQRELSRIASNADSEKCGYEEVVILASVR
jgi:hypothetical protein